MKITITDQILNGNMGDGWADQNDAANGYAAYLTGKYRDAVVAKYPDAEIIIDIDVPTSGCGRKLAVSVDPWDDEAAYEVENNLPESLSYIGSQSWDDWCGGDGSEYFTD